MIEKLKQSHPKIYKHFFTVTTFSKLVALSLFIILPFAGFYLGMKYQKRINVATPVALEVKKLVTPTPVRLDITTWKTYTSNNHNFSFQFPGYLNAGYGNNITGNGDLPEKPTGSQGDTLIITNTQHNKTLELYLLTNIHGLFCQPLYIYKTTVVDNQLTYQRTVGGENKLGNHCPNFFTAFVKLNDGYFLQIDLYDDIGKTPNPNDFEKILSTFKFIQ